MMSRRWTDLVRNIAAATLGVMFAASGAAANCAGVDLLEKLRQDDPATHRLVYEDAATFANHEGVFWRIEKEGVAPSYLFGTIHLAAHGQDALLSRVKDKIDDARLLYVEIAPHDVNALVTRTVREGKIRGSGRLRDDLGAADFARLIKALEARGIGMDNIADYAPWAAIQFIWEPVCGAVQPSDGLSMDYDLMDHAYRAGVRIRGFETSSRRIAIFKSPTRSVQIEMLRQQLDALPFTADWNATFIAAMARRETMAPQAMIRRLWPRRTDQGPDVAAADAFWWDTLIIERNQAFTEKAVKEIDKGGAVIAVGMSHLPTKGGMVALLRAKGFTVTRIE